MDDRAGVDIGGTFTDIVFPGVDGKALVIKVASTPDDYGRAVLQGISEGIAELGIEPQVVRAPGKTATRKAFPPYDQPD